MKYTIASLALATVLSGCVVGNVHSNKVVGEINSVGEARAIVKVGMTQDQVKTKLGSPNSTSTQNNRVIWVYTHAQTNFGGTRILSPYGSIPDTKSVIVTFGSSGRVAQVDFNQQTF